MNRVLLTEKNVEFVPFFFEGNQYVHTIDNAHMLRDLLFFYNFGDIKKARVKPRTTNTDRYLISFGFYSEYNGDMTLGDWIKNNGLMQQFLVW